MTTTAAALHPRFVDTPTAAHHLGLSVSTLNKSRLTGTGPRFHKLGRRVVYTIADLDAWAAERCASSVMECNMRLPRRLSDPAAPTDTIH
jgi:predicted DNA-binding transcriptional regulator AlpA